MTAPTTYKTTLDKWKLPAAGLVAISILFLFRIATASYVHLNLPNRLQDLITLSASVVIESFPFVLLGILLSILVQVWLPARTMHAWLPKNQYLRRFYISFLGVLLPVCECGNLPLARGLIAQGFSVAESVTFLLAAPILNPVTLITTHEAFPSDTKILLARALGALLIANIIGWLFSRHPNPDSLLNAKFLASCKIADKEEHQHSRLERSATLFRQEMGNILPALFLGGLAAGLIQVLVPRSILLSLGGNVIVSILVMMLLAFIVSLCSNVDAFFALAFSSTFTTGAIVSFLVFGPMIDIKMLALMRTTYKPRTLVRITLLVFLLTLALGLAVNYGF